MLILKTATSPRVLDQVHPVPVGTALKDTWLGYKHVLCCSIAGTEDTSVQRHKFDVFNNWHKQGLQIKDLKINVNKFVNNCK